MYPIVLVLQLYFLPLFLGISFLFSFSLYITLGISVLSTVYCVWVTPYNEKSNNVRLLVHKGLEMIIVILLVVAQNFASSSNECYESMAFLVVPSVIILALIVNLIFTLSIIILRIIRWKNTPIDINLFIQQKASMEKKLAGPNANNKNPVYMKKNIHSLNKKQLI